MRGVQWQEESTPTSTSKQEAVALTRSPGATIQGVAADLGINAHMLGKWRKAIEQHRKKAFPGQGHARDEEMMRLKRENARLRKESVLVSYEQVHTE